MVTHKYRGHWYRRVIATAPIRTDDARTEPAGPNRPAARSHAERYLDGSPARVGGSAGGGEPQGHLPRPAGPRSRGRGSGESHRVPARPPERRLPLDAARGRGDRPSAAPVRGGAAREFGGPRRYLAAHAAHPADERRAQNLSVRFHARHRSATRLTTARRLPPTAPSERGPPPLRSRYERRCPTPPGTFSLFRRPGGPCRRCPVRAVAHAPPSALATVLPVALAWTAIRTKGLFGTIAGP
jgi:hypothetical protein